MKLKKKKKNKNKQNNNKTLASKKKKTNKKLLVRQVTHSGLAGNPPGTGTIFHPKGISHVAARDKGKKPGSFTSGMLFPQFPTHFARNNLRRGSAEFSLKKLRGLKIPGVTNVCVGVTKTRSYS